MSEYVSKYALKKAAKRTGTYVAPDQPRRGPRQADVWLNANEEPDPVPAPPPEPKKRKRKRKRKS